MIKMGSVEFWKEIQYYISFGMSAIVFPFALSCWFGGWCVFLKGGCGCLIIGPPLSGSPKLKYSSISFVTQIGWFINGFSKTKKLDLSGGFLNPVGIWLVIKLNVLTFLNLSVKRIGLLFFLGCYRSVEGCGDLRIFCISSESL